MCNLNIIQGGFHSACSVYQYHCREKEKEEKNQNSERPQ